jgi:hypothetical protein
MRFDRPTGEDAEHVAQSSSHGHTVRDRMVSREDKNGAVGFMNQGSDDSQRNRGAVNMTEKRHVPVVWFDTYREKWLASLKDIQCRPPVSYDRRPVNLHRVSETMRAQLVVEPVNFLKSTEVPDKAGDARCCSRP